MNVATLLGYLLVDKCTGNFVLMIILVIINMYHSLLSITQSV